MDALDRARRALSEKHPTTSSLTTLLAVDYLRLNQLEKAEALALRAVEMRRSTLGEDHPLTLSSVSMLANTYVMQHQFDKAQRRGDTAFGTRGKLSKFGNCSPA